MQIKTPSFRIYTFTRGGLNGRLYKGDITGSQAEIFELLKRLRTADNNTHMTYRNIPSLKFPKPVRIMGPIDMSDTEITTEIKQLDFIQ